MYTKITISGKICAGKTSVFRELKKKLAWPTFSSGSYFREYAKKYHLELNNAEEQTNKRTKEVDGMVKDMLSKPGHLLLDAWLGGILADGNPDVLKLLLVANDGVRFKRFAEREHISFEDAKKEVQLRDSSWFEKVKVIHNRSDFFEKEHYNLVIDTSDKSIDGIISIILNKLT